MELIKTGEDYFLLCSFDEKQIAKNAGFRWNGDYRRWTTTNPIIAHKFIKNADERLSAELSATIESIKQEQEPFPVIKPETAICKIIVDVKFLTTGIGLYLIEKNDDFKEIVKAKDYMWDGYKWFKEINFLTGSAVQRMADITQALVGGGFMVRCWDTEAYQLAITGEVDEEQTRWVLLASSGTYTGYLCLTFDRDDDIRAFANTIPGALFHGSRRLYVPPSAVEVVEDFANEYGFTMSRPVLKYLDTYKGLLAMGVIPVFKKVVRNAKKAIKYQKPERLKSDEFIGVVNEEFRD